MFLRKSYIRLGGRTGRVGRGDKRELRRLSGVDMMICRTQNSGYAIHPCVEINLRMNMGVVARLIYDNYVCDGVQGRYVIEYYAKPGEAWHSHLALQEKYPLYLENGKVKSGYLSLTPVENNTSYQAYILI